MLNIKFIIFQKYAIGLLVLLIQDKACIEMR
jgi:hypothetical protein